MKNNIIYIAVIVILVIFGAIGYFYLYQTPTKNVIELKRAEEQAKIEQIKIEDAKQKEEIMQDTQLTVADAITPTKVKEDPIAAEVPKVMLQAHDAYDIALKSALAWNSGATPTFIKTINGIEPDGTAPAWQVGFRSAAGNGYQVVVRGGKVFSESADETSLDSAALPANWKDSAQLLAEIKQNPAYQNSTPESVNYFFKENFKKWYFTISMEEGGSVTGSL